MSEFFKLGQLGFLLVGGAFLIVTQATAQELELAEFDELMTISVEQEPIEEVTVVGPRSLRAMNLEVLAAQDVAFDMYNVLIENSDFRIQCRRERPEHPAFDPIVETARVRVCSTPYMDRESAREVRDYLYSFGNADASPAIRAHMRELNAEINRLAGEDDAFYEAMREWRDLSEDYQAERVLRLGGGSE